MKLLYITENINAVFYSQVVELLNKIQEKNFFEEIYLAIGLRNPEEVKNIDGLNNNIKLITFKTYPMYPILNILTEKSLQRMFKTLHIDESFIIHTRIEFLGSLAFNGYLTIHSMPPNLLVDIRGALVKEVEIYGKMHPILKYLKLLTYKSNMQKTLQNVKYINTVSEELKNYVEKYFLVSSKRISIIPTIAGKEFIYTDKKRRDARSELGIKENEILFIFSSGSSQAWQNDDDIVKKLTQKGYKVLMLTKKKYDNPNVLSLFVSYSDVPKYLNAADIGIIIRNDDIVNNVASPIKFAEYLSCGLPVIANKSVNTIIDLIETHLCGSIVNIEDLDNSVVNSLVAMERKKISEIGIKHFGIENVVEKYINIYTHMKNDIK